MSRKSAQQTSVTTTGWGLLVLRIALGVVFIAHGSQKLFEFTIPGTVQSFGSMGAPLPEVTAPLVAVLEFGGGMLLILGLFTRLVAILLTITMAVAIALAHSTSGFWVESGGFEYAGVLAAGALALALTGSGVLSLDRVMLRGRIPAWVA